MKLMLPTADDSILDVGGSARYWDHVKTPLRITCLNLPGGTDTTYKTHHDITYVEGDGCAMPEFTPRQFDIVFSNSVIEHVGDLDRRAMFAREVRRLSTRYWVQTPYKYYPIEPHCGMPFWWLYPESMRGYFIERWRKKLPAWTEMVETTTIVSADEFRALFPESSVTMEWVVLPKSLIAVST